jgi:hypothetical protein
LVADNVVSVFYEVQDSGMTRLKITQEKEDWNLVLELNAAEEAGLEILQGAISEQSLDGEMLVLKGRGKTIEVRYNSK